MATGPGCQKRRHAAPQRQLLTFYQLALIIPILAGVAGILLLDPKTTGNSVLLSVAQATLPEPFIALITVGGAAAAMVPAGAIAMGISLLVSNNVLAIRNPKLLFRVNHAVVAVAVALALAFGLAKSDIAALLLLTYGGLAQIVPAVAFALARKVRVGGIPVTLGILAGTLTVIITFGGIKTGGVDSGLIALGPNVIVLFLAEAVRRMLHPGQPPVPPEADEDFDVERPVAMAPSSAAGGTGAWETTVAEVQA